MAVSGEVLIYSNFIRRGGANNSSKDYQDGGLNSYKQGILNNHNIYRKQHGLGQLKSSPYVSIQILQ